jgi:hypothetical protein
VRRLNTPVARVSEHPAGCSQRSTGMRRSPSPGETHEGCRQKPLSGLAPGGVRIRRCAVVRTCRRSGPSGRRPQGQPLGHVEADFAVGREDTEPRRVSSVTMADLDHLATIWQFLEFAGFPGIAVVTCRAAGPRRVCTTTSSSHRSLTCISSHRSLTCPQLDQDSSRPGQTPFGVVQPLPVACVVACIRCVSMTRYVRRLGSRLGWELASQHALPSDWRMEQPT